MTIGRLSADEWRSRCQAYQTAADAVMRGWDDPTMQEYRQFRIVAQRLRKQAAACWRMAEARERRDGGPESANPS